MAASSAHEGGVTETAQSQVVERLVKLLDQVEKRVELLREHAASIEQERRGLVDTLSSVASSQELASLTPELREEVSLTVERLQTRVKSVDVSVTTPRSEEQETALGQIEQYVTSLVLRMTSDPKGASNHFFGAQHKTGMACPLKLPLSSTHSHSSDSSEISLYNL
ncbi:BAG family molecular chaperone regulator 2 isoform X3 [Dermacentor albipictus]|uniref:BAG family molecular chaperone regulator 2 isoform X3 n=1 Tax=Dermacentor albipictus TaxID=60249 RepID=UPI0031FBBA40